MTKKMEDRWHKLTSWEFAELKRCDVLYVTDEFVKRAEDWLRNTKLSCESKRLLWQLPIKSLVLDFSKGCLSGGPEFISISTNEKAKEFLIEWDTGGYRDFYIKRKWAYNPETDKLVHLHTNIKNDFPNHKEGLLVFNYAIFLFANKTMLEHQDEVSVEKVSKSHLRKTKSGKRKRVVRHFKCYSITGKRTPETKEKHEILCPAWSVRGHMRHYKSGKVVFINPYIKGKKRNESEFVPKEHKIFPTIKMEVESGKAEGL